MTITEHDGPATPRGSHLMLTNPERRLLLLLAMGLSTVEAAWQLASSRAEVVVNRSRLFHKLGVTTDEEVIPFAGRHGLIP
jgi:DNA-binding CsgD family transcriptional regulator